MTPEKYNTPRMTAHTETTLDLDGHRFVYRLEVSETGAKLLKIISGKILEPGDPYDPSSLNVTELTGDEALRSYNLGVRKLTDKGYVITHTAFGCNR